ncbi:MAG: CAP domain-containing protein [Ilumatobacteraceae bacterium]
MNSMSGTSHSSPLRSRIAIATGVGLISALLLSTTVSAENTPAIPRTADWLTTVNYFRASSGLSPVVADSAMSQGAAQHSCYMLYNGMSHDELPGLPGYSAAGDTAGNNSNVAVSSVLDTTARSFIELWMSGPFHAIGVLRSNLQSSGFGKCDLPGTPTWHSGATLDVIHGLGSAVRPAWPIVFPGNGATTNLDRFVAETPSPLTYCGWSGPAGLPLVAMMPEAATNPTAWIIGPNGPMQVCVLSAANTSGTGQEILQGDNAVVVVPRTVLAPGTYNVTVGTTARDVAWSFTVDPSVADVAPTPVAVPTTSATGFAPLAPTRIVDSRIALGTSRLGAQSVTRIQIAGRLGVPAEAKAVVANMTVIGTAGSGFLTAWNCSAVRPEVSTLNFAPNDTVANAATIPLDNDGGLCVFANVSADLVIDVSGYYSESATGRYMPVMPRRLMDSRQGLGTPTRLVGGEIVELPVTGGAAAVPSDATAVALNVTGVFPTADGFITAYPCSTMPPTSSLNPAVGRVTPNLVIAPVSPRGTVCFFSNVDVDLVVDVVGYVSSTATSKFTPSTPFRFTDTRDLYRVDVNAGQAGTPLSAGQTITIAMAGQRGIPTNARAISANITAVDGTANGFITAFPCGDVPTASNVNFTPVEAIANAAELPLSSSGSICLFSSSSVHLIIDVNGWWS